MMTVHAVENPGSPRFVFHLQDEPIPAVVVQGVLLPPFRDGIDQVLMVFLPIND